MTENNQNDLTERMFKEGLTEWAKKVFLPAFEKILDAKLDKYLGGVNHIGDELKVINKMIHKIAER
jgi:hypothetical protein